uniref:Uncharacterized protein n=1 Tax=Amphimedon queenslandica TaxID=400682 RepID=A0A1X7VL23_AMPQE
MIYQLKCLQKTYKQVAESLNVDCSTVSRIVALYDTTGGVTKKYSPNMGTRKLTEMDRLLIVELVTEKPGIFLHVIQDILIDETGTEVNSSTS